MASILYIGDTSGLESGAFTLIPINPNQPRGMRKNQPAKQFPTLEGPGAVQSPKAWYPPIIFTWPAIAPNSNANHAALLAAFEDRQYIKTGLDFYIGIQSSATKDNGFIFPVSAKEILIRIIEVRGPENPIDNDINDQIQNMIVTAIWLDPS